jgi:hypothetical protein
MGPLDYIKIGAAAAGLIAAGVLGDSIGANRVIARDARAFQHAQDAMKHAAKKLNAAQDRLAAAEGQRRETVREIYREVPTIVDRPVYRTVCSDDDGVSLLDRAAAAANGGGPQPVARSGQGGSDPAQR